MFTGFGCWVVALGLALVLVFVTWVVGFLATMGFGCWFVVLLGMGRGLVVVVTVGDVVVRFKSNCPVRFGCWFTQVTIFPIFPSLPWNISSIILCTLLFAGLSGCSMVVGGGQVTSLGGGVGRTIGSVAAAAAPTPGGLGWRRSWRPIWLIGPILRRVASPPPS